MRKRVSQPLGKTPAGQVDDAVRGIVEFDKLKLSILRITETRTIQDFIDDRRAQGGKCYVHNAHKENSSQSGEAVHVGLNR